MFRYSRWSGVRSVASASSVMPRIAFIGVRTSCDMFARKVLFARFAASAARRASLNSSRRARSRDTSWQMPTMPTTFPSGSRSGTRVTDRNWNPEVWADHRWASSFSDGLPPATTLKSALWNCSARSGSKKSNSVLPTSSLTETRRRARTAALFAVTKRPLRSLT